MFELIFVSADCPVEDGGEDNGIEHARVEQLFAVHRDE